MPNMNYLTYQTVTNGGRLPNGPHFKHCYIYIGEHCSCGGDYQGSEPGPEINAAQVMSLAEARTP